jgi:hypothetical protein
MSDLLFRPVILVDGGHASYSCTGDSCTGDF